VQFGTDTYRAGALERLEESRSLKDNGHVVSSIYLSGLAVEGMLRSLLWLRDKRFDERHDLRRIAVRIEELGLLRSGQRDQDFVEQVEGVVRLWTNDFRFAGTEQLLRWLRQIGALIGRTDSLRSLCETHWNQCSEVVRRCETLWQRSQSKKR
jgi:hypothetical protein